MSKIINKLIFCEKPIKILIIIAITIGIYNIVLRKIYGSNIVNYDILNKKIFSIPLLENCCSGWTISHFIFYLILGFIFPDCIIVIFIISIFWEFIEVFIGSYLYGNSWKRQITRVNNNIEYSTNWWAGSYKDIIFNFFGLLVGYILQSYL